MTGALQFTEKFSDKGHYHVQTGQKFCKLSYLWAVFSLIQDH